jgi:GNAT superfamily N-acetyltransferase
VKQDPRRARGERGVRAAVRVRKARLGDAAAMSAVMRASIRTLARGAYAARALAAWSSLPPLYHAWAMTAGGETCFAAERARRVVGYAALRGSEVTAVFVRPAAARRGVGAALLARVEREARRRGERALFTKAALSGAAFYRARGFAGERRVRVPLPGGGALAAVLLRKRL